jgi:unsaturated rhamnogalacturonyl hydrolase
MFEMTTDKKTGLLYHAYDHSRKSDWADKKTGKSSEFWGRAIGWIIIGTMDIMTFMKKTHPSYKILSDYVYQLLLNLIKFQSSEGRWYQIVNKVNESDNWYENSCSALFTGGIYKAISMEILDKKYKKAANHAFMSIINSMKYEKNTLILDNICVGTNVGNYEHYIKRSTSKNDLHGVGAFLIMCSEAF